MKSKSLLGSIFLLAALLFFTLNSCDLFDKVKQNKEKLPPLSQRMTAKPDNIWTIKVDLDELRAKMLNSKQEDVAKFAIPKTEAACMDTLYALWDCPDGQCSDLKMNNMATECPNYAMNGNPVFAQIVKPLRQAYANGDKEVTLTLDAKTVTEENPEDIRLHFIPSQKGLFAVTEFKTTVPVLEVEPNDQGEVQFFTRVDGFSEYQAKLTGSRRILGNTPILATEDYFLGMGVLDIHCGIGDTDGGPDCLQRSSTSFTYSICVCENSPSLDINTTRIKATMALVGNTSTALPPNTTFYNVIPNSANKFGGCPPCPQNTNSLFASITVPLNIPDTTNSCTLEFSWQKQNGDIIAPPHIVLLGDNIMTNQSMKTQIGWCSPTVQ